MTVATAAQAAYLVAALLFVLSLAGLSKHETSRNGVVFGIAGMTLALVATIVLALQGMAVLGVVLLIVAMVAGGGIGLWRARVVEMTGMPELIALLHSFVGLTAVATCRASTTPRCASACSSAPSPSPARSWRSSSCRPGSGPRR